MPDLIRHPETKYYERLWIPGQARNDITAVNTVLSITTQPLKGGESKRGIQPVFIAKRLIHIHLTSVYEPPSVATECPQ